MRTFKFLFCAACLCGVGVFTKTALTQEKEFPDKPSQPPQRSGGNNFDNGQDAPRFTPGVDPFKKKPPIGSEDAPFQKDPAPSYPGATAGVPGMSGGGYPGMLGASGMGDMMGGPGMRGAPMRARRFSRTVVEMRYEAIPKEELEASKKLQAAIQSLKTGKDDAARKAAADIIELQLTTQFESDLKQREKELLEVEQRVKSLREQLDKRKAAQADIINLRLQTLINDANGLGFPDSNFGIADQFDVETQPVDTPSEKTFEVQRDFPPFDDDPTAAPKRNQ